MNVLPSSRGVLVKDPRLALDTAAPGFASVVSHAHGDHIPWEAERALATPETAALLAERAPHIDVEAIPYGEPHRVGGAVVTLLPAGHILGSAMVHVERDGDSLLYTGDFKLKRCRTCPPAEARPARLLLTETTFGLPVFRFPDREDVEPRILAFAEDALAAGETPVLLGYNLGKAQEILATLTAAGIPTMAHGAAHNLCRVYERFGHAFPGLKPYHRDRVDGHALVVPPGAATQPMVQRLRRRRVAYCSGWAHLEKSRTQRDADARIPLSDHCDFPDLLEFVRRVRPERVLTLHGYADAFAHVLSEFEGVPAATYREGHAQGEEVEE